MVVLEGADLLPSLEILDIPEEYFFLVPVYRVSGLYKGAGGDGAVADRRRPGLFAQVVSLLPGVRLSFQYPDIPSEIPGPEVWYDIRRFPVEVAD